MDAIKQIEIRKDDFFITLARNSPIPSSWQIDRIPKRIPNVNQLANSIDEDSIYNESFSVKCIHSQSISI